MNFHVATTLTSEFSVACVFYVQWLPATRLATKRDPNHTGKREHTDGAREKEKEREREREREREKYAKESGK